MEKTAVEWLIEQIFKYRLVPEGTNTDNVLFHKAKEMEKEQMSNAMLHGWRKALDEEVHSIDPNDFYNKTFKSE